MLPGDPMSHSAPGSYPYLGELRVAASVLEEMVAVARAGLPNEACGLAAGCDGVVTRAYPLTNTAASPERYEVDPYEQLKAYESMAEEGLDAMVVFHSHPATPARPSVTDIAEAFDAEAAYVIVSLASHEPSVRAFRIEDGVVGELEIQVVDPQAEKAETSERGQ